MNKYVLIAKRDELEQSHKNGNISRDELLKKAGEINLSILRIDSEGKNKKLIEQTKISNEAMGNFLGGLFLILGLLYGLPSIVILVANFFKLVVFGSCTLSEFKFNWEVFSFEPVNLFYQGIWGWFQDLIYKLNH